MHIFCGMYLHLGLHVQIRLYYVLPYKEKISAQHSIGFILDRCIAYLGLTMPNLQKKRLLIFEIFNINKCTLFLEPTIYVFDLMGEKVDYTSKFVFGFQAPFHTVWGTCVRPSHIPDRVEHLMDIRGYYSPETRPDFWSTHLKFTHAPCCSKMGFYCISVCDPRPIAQSVPCVLDLTIGGRWFDPRIGQYSFRGLMIVIATGFILLSHRCPLFRQWL